jgi:hypothetical protein
LFQSRVGVASQALIAFELALAANTAAGAATAPARPNMLVILGDDTGERSDMLQRKTRLNGQMRAILRAHIGSLMQDPPVQKAKTLDFSRLLYSLQKGRQ